MQIRPRRRSDHASDLIIISLAFAWLSCPSSASTYDCHHIRVDGQSFDLSPLSGAYSIHHLDPHPPSIINTTYTLDICKPLRKTKGVPKSHDCPNLTRVCGIERVIQDEDDGGGDEDRKKHDEKEDEEIRGVIPIAGDFVHHGKPLNAQWTRLKTSSSNADSEKEGLRVELHGGEYPFEQKHAKPQKAIIEFLCDRDRTGLEGLVEGDGKGQAETEESIAASTSVSDRRSVSAKNARNDALDGSASVLDDDRKGQDDDDDGDHQKGDDEDDDDEDDQDDGKSLKFIRYGPTSEDINEDTLRLEWRTRYACEGIKDEDGDSGRSPSGSGHWGLFTWFIIM